MIYIFAIFVSILTLLSFYRYLSLKRDLTRIVEELNGRIDLEDYTELLVQTGDAQIQNLLLVLNRLNKAKRDEYTIRRETEIGIHEMISNVSHDLKTPLTVILGYLEMLGSEALEEDERDEIQKNLIVKINHVIELINKFFSLAKLESGDEKISFDDVNLTEVLRENIIFFEEILEKKDFELLIDWGDEDILIHSNKDALFRIINNLFSNVIRYGYHGKFLGLHLEEDQTCVTLQVVDKGQGIPKKDLERVFDRSFTGSNSRNSDKVGSGLGLAIVQTLSEKLGGTIRVQSEPNKETVFTLELSKRKDV